MKLTFTKSLEELKSALSSLEGDWNETANMMTLRVGGGIMNWWQSTGRIQFQGKSAEKESLESKVRHLLYPNEFSEPTQGADQDAIETTEEILEGSLTLSQDSPELVFGMVSAVGTRSNRLTELLKERLSRSGYKTQEIRVSSLLAKVGDNFSEEYERIVELMKRGDSLREKSKNNAILAEGVAAEISRIRNNIAGDKKAYLINSLKRPEEVEFLRTIYGEGFFLIGLHCDEKRRLKNLESKGILQRQAVELTEIDEDENADFGQRTRDAYHRSDFFVNIGAHEDMITHALNRFIDLVFGHPHKNPTFDEFAMFMAFAASIRSGDLSRQVGAVITKNQQIISTGANECPQAGGGLYWAETDPKTGEITDKERGKDSTRGQDANKMEQQEISNDIVNKLIKKGLFDVKETVSAIEAIKESRISDLTEFGRAVHAEMEALISCSREGISTRNTNLYCTTFPCHNCAKHIIGAGLRRVVYVEPYPKSKALELHSDSIELKSELSGQEYENEEIEKVFFEPFTGVGSRRFLDLFSMSMGAGKKLKRKDSEGNAVEWNEQSATVRVPLLQKSYLELEQAAAISYSKATRP
ncbi:MAG: cytidine deaminase [Verrucomicrobiae bacterium]|nr:cytidine deaminase [Verrucomicrobiae bacterium]